MGDVNSHKWKRSSAIAGQIGGSDQERAGCAFAAVKAKLRKSGLRPTRQRLQLGWMLFAHGDRHVSAEALYDEANRLRAHLSLATVYNTLRQFTDAGLLRQIQLGTGRAYFDTNMGEHHHFQVEGEDLAFDVPGHALTVGNVPEPPDGYQITGVDVIVRLKRQDVGSSAAANKARTTPAY